MTVFTPLADRIGKNLSEKKIITAMEEELGGQDVYDASSWDNNIYRNEVHAYGEVLYDLLVKLPEQREKNLEIAK